MIKSSVTVFRLPCTKLTYETREEWFQDRQSGFSYQSKFEGEEAAEEAFELTNAPEDYLTEEQQQILEEQSFKGPSTSVGDIIKVEPIVRGTKAKLSEYYLCKSRGWEKFEGDIIKLLRHLS